MTIKMRGKQTSIVMVFAFIVVVVASCFLGAGQAFAAGDPVINSVSPNPIYGGRTLTITGTDFGSFVQGRSCIAGVYSASTPNPYSLWSDTKITCIFPEMVTDRNIHIVTGTYDTSDNVYLDVKPTITTATPSTVETGATLTIRGHSIIKSTDLKIFLSGKEIPQYLWYSTSTNNNLVTRVPDDATSGNLHLQLPYGTSNTKYITVEQGSTTTGFHRYFAEGCTNWGFSTQLELLVNATGGGGPLNVTYNTESGAVEGAPITTDAKKKVVLNLNSDVPGHDVSTHFHREDFLTLYGQRLMFWNNMLEGHMSPLMKSPEKSWYLAEGSTAWGFETWICLQNPWDKDVAINITYMTDTGPVAMSPRTVTKNSRMTINTANDIPNRDFSTRITSDDPILVERAMYWDNRRGGTNSRGACDETVGQIEWSVPSTDFYLAEGTTGWGFTTWILIQNPNDNPVDIDLTYMTPAGPVAKPRFSIGAQSRFTINANADIPSTDISVQVHGSSPIIAERAMYWNNGTGKAGHASVGVSRRSTGWGFGAGHTEAPFESWLLVQNPNNEPAIVRLSIYDENGFISTFEYDMPALSRKTVNLASYVPDKSISSEMSLMNASKTSTINCISEMAIYWNGRTGGDCSLGVTP